MPTLPELLGSLERLVGELYGYRFAVVAIALLLAGAVGLAVHRAGLAVTARRWAEAHRGLALAIVVAALVVAIPLGNYTLSPLWTRSTLEEASPLEQASTLVVTSSSASPVDAIADAMPRTPESALGSRSTDARVLRAGDLAGADSFHFGRGRVLLLDTADGSRVLRFEGLSVRNGPDLFVMLSNSTGSVVGAFNLGALKATDGSFNYEVPAQAEGAALDYALIWCRQFGVLFASAPLVDAS